MNRYAAALAKGRKEYEQAVDEDRRLFQDFGLRLLSTNGGGVRLAIESELRGSKIHPWNVIELTPKAWAVMRPIMIVAAQHRDENVISLLQAAAK